MAFDQGDQNLGTSHVDIESRASGDDLLISRDHRKWPLAIMRDVEARLAFQQMKRAVMLAIADRDFTVGLKRQLRTVRKRYNPALARDGLVIVGPVQPPITSRPHRADDQG